MASSSQRAEYHDKTLAKNAFVDRKLKIRISDLDSAKNIWQREVEREEKAIRQELCNNRRMSTNSPRMPNCSSRRSSIPAKCMSEDVSTITHLQLPKDTAMRRRSLPDINKIALPSIGNNTSLTASPQLTAKSLEQRGVSRRCSELSTNFGNLSQLQTPSLSPRTSISSIVSSLSNSTNRLQNLKDSEETFEKVRQFLKKLEESKSHSQSFEKDSDEDSFNEEH